MSKRDRLRQLPAVDTVLNRPDVQALMPGWTRALVTEGVRRAVASRRQVLLAGEEPTAELSGEDVRRALEAYLRPHLQTVLNATGVVLHTNLGRALLSGPALDHLLEIAGSYNNLEFDLDSGQRGSRADVMRGILLERCGAEDALVVNNNAGAVYLGLRALAAGREVLVSRGELVEIGGSFRIPDVMAASGAKLVEVGTTNKTHLRDYEQAIGPDAALLLKVHRSNFELVGFTQEVALDELVQLGHKQGLPVMVDLGTGTLLENWPAPLDQIPVVQHVLASGVDVACFSGDKVLGGPQCGILVGKRRWIQRLAADPMARALRVGKLTLAALEISLSAYRGGLESAKELPVVHMLLLSEPELATRAKKLEGLLREASLPVAGLRQVQGQVGGGSLPLVKLSGWAVALTLPEGQGEQLLKTLRLGDPALLGRVQHDELLLDVRTLRKGELALAVRALRAAWPQA